MSALHTSTPALTRLTRQHTFFNNEGWQLRSGNILSGLEASDSYTNLVSDPGHLTNFITDSDGIRPTGSGDSSVAIRTAWNNLITWVGFVDVDGVEVPPNHTISKSNGDVLTIDFVLAVEVDAPTPATPFEFLTLGLVQNATTVIHFSTTAGNSAEFSTPNVIRYTVVATELVTDGVYQIQPAPGTDINTVLFLNNALTVTTVAEPGHAVERLFPSSASGTNVFGNGQAIEGASTVTVVA